MADSVKELGAANGERRVSIDASVQTVSANRLPRRIPLFVPRDQAYYWTREWQQGEAEADEEIRRGELRRFKDIDDAMRWLDSPED